MIVYIVVNKHGLYEKVFKTKEKAKTWIKEHSEHFYYIDEVKVIE